MARAHQFTQASDAVRARIRAASEARGFAVTRLLTHWSEIVGPATAAIARPIGVTYGRGGAGATLTLLVLGPASLRVEMEKESIRARVNACYGHRAIAKLRITQAGPAAFAKAALPDSTAREPDQDMRTRGDSAAAGVGDTELRLALASLAANVLARRRP